MTTVTPQRDNNARLGELDELTQAAWMAYSERLRDLTGSEYSQAEEEGWSLLQDELADLGAQRATITASAIEQVPPPAK